MGRLELEFPTSSGLKSMGLRPSAFIDASDRCWSITQPTLTDIGDYLHSEHGLSTGGSAAAEHRASHCTGRTVLRATLPDDDYIRSAGFKEFFLGNSAKPRLSIGIGVNWISPFGPLRHRSRQGASQAEGR